jgi:hypothetical protein
MWSRISKSNLQRPDLARGYSTVDGDRLYVLTESGDLACLLAADATIVWQRNILKDFSGRNIQWLISESPLVDGDRVIVTPGGRGAGMVALDKMTGKTVWVSKELSGRGRLLCPPWLPTSRRPAYTTLTGSRASGVRALTASCCGGTHRPTTPRTSPRHWSTARIFYTSNYDTGGGL